MAFHVTQCPGCESTFNTSARILQSAAGKVRCGACLMVFEAAENFVDAVDIDEEENSSVFVGNDPSDYFDPSSFFTRSALTAPEEPAYAFDPAGISTTHANAEPEVTTTSFSANSVSRESAAPVIESRDSAIPETVTSETSISETVISELVSPPDLPFEHAQNHTEIADDYEHESQEFFSAIAEELETETAEPFEANTDVETSAPFEPITPRNSSPEDIRLHASFSMYHRPPPAETKPDSLEDPEITEALIEPATQEELAAELSSPQDEIEIIDLDVFDEFVETGGDSFSPAQDFTATSANSADAVDGFDEVEGTYSVADSYPAEDSYSAEGSNEVEDSDAAEDPFSNSAVDSINQIVEVDITAPANGAQEAQAQNSFEEIADEETPGQVTQAEDTPDVEIPTEDTLDQDTSDQDTPDQETLDQETLDKDILDKEILDNEVLEEEIPGEFIVEKAFYSETIEEAGLQETVLEEATAIAADNDSTESIRARAFRALLRDDEALEALPLESRSAIGKVLPPVELLAGRERFWGRRVLMALACILLGMTLGGQFLWQQFPVYSRTAQLRPLYEFACRVLSCELPVYSEISAIRSDNLVVRSHQSVEEALTVSLTFRNTAPFPQPFPVLILSFNSASNNIIALREFAPSEYLDTGLQNIALMPVMAPVQIDLDVIDPGADAVNYTVAYRRP